MMKPTPEPPRDLHRSTSRYQVLCANPFCGRVVLYPGETCRTCTAEQTAERARLQAQKASQ